MVNVSNTQSEDENERFESTISFPNFLLQVNAVMRKLGEGEMQALTINTSLIIYLGHGQHLKRQRFLVPSIEVSSAI